MKKEGRSWIIKRYFFHKLNTGFILFSILPQGAKKQKGPPWLKASAGKLPKDLLSPKQDKRLPTQKITRSNLRQKHP